MTPTQLNREYLIRYYPDKADRCSHYLIGPPVLIGILARNKTIDSVLRRLENNPNDRLTVTLNRGCEFVFIPR